MDRRVCAMAGRIGIVFRCRWRLVEFRVLAVVTVVTGVTGLAGALLVLSRMDTGVDKITHGKVEVGFAVPADTAASRERVCQSSAGHDIREDGIVVVVVLLGMVAALLHAVSQTLIAFVGIETRTSASSR